jgi:hypothetical protein
LRDAAEPGPLAQHLHILLLLHWVLRETQSLRVNEAKTKLVVQRVTAMFERRSIKPDQLRGHEQQRVCCLVSHLKHLRVSHRRFSNLRFCK